MIKIEDVSFNYTGDKTGSNGIKNINLTINKGEFVVLCGKSGCGKTTLTRVINGLIPHFYEGEMEGSVYIDDANITKQSLSDISTLVGSVFQNPKSQFFHVDTTGELLFGCENHNMSKELMEERLNETADVLQIRPLLNRNIFELSGGEKQQIACGSVYASDPEIFVMDEPTSNLDRKAINRLHHILEKLKSDGKTIVISEHRLYFLIDLADRFIYVKDGEIAGEYTAEEFREFPNEKLFEMGLRTTDLSTVKGHPLEGKPSKPVVTMSDLSCQRNNSTILDVDDLKLPKNSVVAFIGDNGTGKSTLAEALCGVLGSMGTVSIDDTIMDDKQRAKACFMVMQDVNRQLFCESVLDELKLNSDVSDEQELTVLERLGIDGLKDRHPSSLSGGQKQRVAIASAICSGKKIIFYDEPTSGLDYEGMENFSKIIRNTESEVEASIIITHDLELILNCCTHVVHMEKGRLVSVYPLDEAGIDKVRYYFTTESEEAHTTKRGSGSAMNRIIERMGAYKKHFYAAIICMILGVAASIFPYAMLYKITGKVLSEDVFSIRDVFLPILGIFFGNIFYGLFYTKGLSLSHIAAFNTLQAIRIKLKDKLNKQPIGTIRQIGTGALKKIFTDDIEDIEVILAHAIPEGISNLLVSLGILVFMFSINFQLALVAFCAVPLGLLCMKRMYDDGVERMGGYFAAAKRMNNAIVEYINGMEVVKVFNYQSESYKSYEASVVNYKNLSLSWYRACWPWIALYMSLLPNMLLFALPVGTVLIMSGVVAINDFILIICMSLAIGPHLLRALSFASYVTQINYKIQALERVLDRAELREGTESFTGDEQLDVEFKNVHFSYNDNEVLKDVSFVAKAGEMTAVVGESGSGKSTIARLLAHQYDTDGGSITVGGKKITDLSLSELNSKISFVSQEIFLFNRSIMENIRIGNPGATDKMVLEAARKAACDEFIEKLPLGYQTKAGDAGKKLSGGERQRIALARAILKDAPIVILDEATSSIDLENEDKINKAIDEIIKGKTVIVIAHKLSAMRNADKFVLIQNGKVVGEGNKTEIMKDAYFKQLYKLSKNAEEWMVNNFGDIKEDKAI
ncbi:MAG: ATP-binding cassette domain-containing protein [Butyrivibrio sp.]|nr:ATP-binding cassette domain-containing protein [Butyrivibrio sp.]